MVAKGPATHFLFIGYAKSGRNGGCFGRVQRNKQTPFEALAKASCAKPRSFRRGIPSCNEPPEVVHLRRRALSTFRLCGSGATIFRPVPFVGGWAARSFQCCIVTQLLVPCGRVVSLVADQPFGQLVEETSIQESFPSMALGMRSAFDR